MGLLMVKQVKHIYYASMIDLEPMPHGETIFWWVHHVQTQFL